MTQGPASRSPKIRKITKDYLERAGLHYLQRFAAPEAHFRTVLVRKVERAFFRDPDNADQPAWPQVMAWIDELVERFRKYGYLDDAQFIDTRIRAMQRKGKSRLQIRMDLQGKGVDRDQIARHWGSKEQNADEFAALRYCRRRRLGPYRHAQDPATDTNAPQVKELSKLVRQGFAYDLARQVLDMDYDEAESRLAGVDCAAPD